MRRPPLLTAEISRISMDDVNLTSSGIGASQLDSRSCNLQSPPPRKSVAGAWDEVVCPGYCSTRDVQFRLGAE
ncbi:hypothetical protein CBOM_01859 [Ceraceosorus bombacis]|uniref:Uncharacterized protein n=1 Tax=Ceraceosorus bombacis TaxID=401625 RepID=A0A0P1BF23_9BASI|nr:hypothetical protein CBOM_01859 [Ceraceosorus bombacis]